MPIGARFKVEVLATRLTENDVRFLLGVLEHGQRHPTHPYQLGANTADGWGRVKWDLDKVVCLQKRPRSRWRRCRITPGPRKCGRLGPLGADALGCRVVPHVAVEFEASRSQGPFLVNDGWRRRKRKTQTGGRRPISHRFAGQDGSVWLPSSSFRGALRRRRGGSCSILWRGTRRATPPNLFVEAAG